MLPLESAIEPRTQPRYVVQDFVESVETVITLDHDGARRLPYERVVEEIERAETSILMRAIPQVKRIAPCNCISGGSNRSPCS